MNGFDRDPLRIPKHRVICQTSPGFWTLIGETAEPIEMLRLNVGFNHAVGLKDQEVMITDERNAVVERFEAYSPVQELSEEELNRQRARWISSVMAFILPKRLYDLRDHPEVQQTLRRFLRAKKIKISIRPDGRCARIWRGNNILAEWGE